MNSHEKIHLALDKKLTAIETNISWLKKLTWLTFSGIMINVLINLIKLKI